MQVESESRSILIDYRKPLAPFIGYLIFFYVVWTFVAVYGVLPWAVTIMGDETFSYSITEIIFSFLICVLPVFLYLRYVDKVNPFEYLQLKQHWKRGVIVGLTIAVIYFLVTIAFIGMPNWGDAYVTWHSILCVSIFVGFFEEIPFRGFILKKLQERFNFWTSTVISSVLFVGIHIPGYVMSGPFTLYDFLFLFFLGVIMAIILRYSKSLWAPIITHSLKNCIAIVFLFS
jgi:hypothetical protein